MFEIYFEFLAGVYASQGHKWVIIAKTLIRNTLLWMYQSRKPSVGTQRLDGTKERILTRLNFCEQKFWWVSTNYKSSKKRPKWGVF
jgi:hypothetical protein